MNKRRVQVEDNLVLDGNKTIYGVTSVDLPEITWKTISIPAGYGMAGDIEMPTRKLDALEMTVNTDTGEACEQLSRPGVHNIELREVVTDFNTAKSDLEYKSVKYRTTGHVASVADGSSKISEAKEGSVKYNLTYYEKEVDGRVVRVIDIPGGVIMWDGVDYSAAIQSLLN